MMHHIKRLIIPILLLVGSIIGIYTVNEIDQSPLTIMLLIPFKWAIAMVVWHITRKTYLKDYDAIYWDKEKLDSKAILSIVMLVCITYLAGTFS